MEELSLRVSLLLYKTRNLSYSDDNNPISSSGTPVKSSTILVLDCIMSYQTPTSRAELQVGELGSLAGFAYSNGVRQFCGIPYGRISKRWTRAVLADSWAAKLHDGTKLG